MYTIHILSSCISSSLSFSSLQSLQMTSKISCHARSISLPSTVHPLDATTDDHLSKLRISCQCPSSSSSSSISRNLVDVKDLFERINDLILLQLNQLLLSNDQINRHSLEAVLEGSLSLLDICGSTIDIVTQMKEFILELESSLRRRSDEANFLSAYKVSRRKMIKSVSKCLGDLKKVDTWHLQKDDQRLVFVVRILREAQVICLSILKSILDFLSGSKARQGWSLVARLTLQTREEANEVEKIDQALSAKKLSSDVKSVHSLLRQLGSMEMIINEIEDGLVSVSRCLVKTRVSLLNVLNH